MDDKRKSTRAYVRANIDIPLYTNLPYGVRKNQKVDTNPSWKPRGSTLVNSQYKTFVGSKYSSLSSELETTRLLGVFHYKKIKLTLTRMFPQWEIYYIDQM